MITEELTANTVTFIYNRLWSQWWKLRAQLFQRVEMGTTTSFVGGQVGHFPGLALQGTRQVAVRPNTRTERRWVHRWMPQCGIIPCWWTFYVLPLKQPTHTLRYLSRDMTRHVRSMQTAAKKRFLRAYDHRPNTSASTKSGGLIEKTSLGQCMVHVPRY